ncbi:hypothetical protein JXA85_04980 [Candidatus Woesearchaeota archaeon]|nr:hypothetical protein [Candidatus Woesearchaeota archaeon]
MGAVGNTLTIRILDNDSLEKILSSEKIDSADLKRLYNINDLLDLYDVVIKNFEEALKSSVPWSKNNIPDQSVTDSVKAGKYVFSVKTTPTTSKPRYAEQKKALVEDVNRLVNQYNRGYLTIRRGSETPVIIASGGHHYVALDFILNDLGYFEEEKGMNVRKSIDYDKKQIESNFLVQKVLNYLSDPVDESVELTTKWAEMYMLAKEQTKKLKKHKEAIRLLIKKMTEQPEQEIPNQTEYHEKKVGGTLVSVKSIPAKASSIKTELDLLRQYLSGLRNGHQQTNEKAKFLKQNSLKYENNNLYLSTRRFFREMNQIEYEQSHRYLRQPFALLRKFKEEIVVVK